MLWAGPDGGATGRRYRPNTTSALAYTKRPLYPNGDAPAHGKIP